MTFPTPPGTQWAARLALNALALVAVAFCLAPAASAQDPMTGQIVIQQRGPNGALALGGCYQMTRDGFPDEERQRCDGYDQAGTNDGIVNFQELPAGTYRLTEYQPPRSHTPAPGEFSVTLTEGDSDTVTRVHERLPVLAVVAKDSSGAAVTSTCWMVHSPGEYEGVVEDACDDDDGANDGTTQLTTLTPNDYELRHTQAPAPFRRIPALTPFTMEDAAQTLTFTLERVALPVNVAPPTVSGTAAVGETLNGNPGTWTGSGIEYLYSWQRCDAAGQGCMAIVVGNSQYTVAPADLGHTIRFAVEAENEAGEVDAFSAAIPVQSLGAPENTSPPTVTGHVEVGQRMTANPGTWTGAPAFAYQWQHCDASGQSCVDIPRAAGSTYTSSTADVGYRFRFVVTASNGAGGATAASQPTARLTAAPYNAERPFIRGSAEVGQQLEAYPGHWISHFGGLQFEYRWFRCNASDITACSPIDGGVGDLYTVRAADEGMRLRVQVTGTDAGGSGTAQTNPTTIVPSVLPVNTRLPRVLGPTPLPIGTRLIADVGEWTSAYGAISYQVAWLRCDNQGENCVRIHDDYRTSYLLTVEDALHKIRIAVIARNSRGSRYAHSETSPLVYVPQPHATRAPAIIGTPILGMRLSSDVGEWTSPLRPLRYDVFWFRCNYLGENCVRVEDRASRTWVVTKDDLGEKLKIAVVASNGYNYNSATSALTESARMVQPDWTRPAAINGTPVVGMRLTADVGTWTSPIGTLFYDVYWYRCNEAGANCVRAVEGNPRFLDLTFDLIGDTIKMSVVAWTIHGYNSYTTAPTPIVLMVQPQWTRQPAINGTAVVGMRLTADVGDWTTQYGTLHYDVYWYRCNEAGNNCTRRVEGNPRWLQLTYDDIGYTIKMSVVAWTAHGYNSNTSLRTPTILMVQPQNVRAPQVRGPAVVGARLVADVGGWTTPYGTLRYDVYWWRCDANGANCVRRDQGNPVQLILTRDDLGSTIKMSVVAWTAHGYNSSTSVPTGIVR